MATITITFPRASYQPANWLQQKPFYLVEVANQIRLLIASTNNNSASSDVDRWTPSYNNQGNSYTNTNTANNSSDDNQASQSDEDIDSLLKQLYALPLSQRHVESDGLVFDPAQITSRTARGVAVPHGNHYHFIPYSQMSELEERIARIIPLQYSSNHRVPDSRPEQPSPQPTWNLVQARNLHQLLNQLQEIQLTKN